jgi:Cu/Ag efflux protein CusF
MRIASQILASAALAAALATASAWAQQPQTVRLRGTIEKVDGNTLQLKLRDGTLATLTLTGNALIVAMVKASLAEIKEGSFIGSGAMPQADGSQKALEVHIFAESQRGTGEGHRPWDGAPNSTMTNGTVGSTVTGVEGPVITVKYKDGEKKIMVPPGVPIVRYEIGNASELKAGASFTVIAAMKKPDDTFEAQRINVGRDGVVPQ